MIPNPHLEPGDILQVDPDVPEKAAAHWCAGRLMIVHRVESWGVWGYIWSNGSATPNKARIHKPAFARLGWDVIALTGGKAMWRLDAQGQTLRRPNGEGGAH